jgi:hypothetical protein
MFVSRERLFDPICPQPDGPKPSMPWHCPDMCGRFAYNLTWPEIVKLYRLSPDTQARN